jgi:hypothetical protein
MRVRAPKNTRVEQTTRGDVVDKLRPTREQKVPIPAQRMRLFVHLRFWIACRRDKTDDLFHGYRS